MRRLWRSDVTACARAAGDAGYTATSGIEGATRAIGCRKAVPRRSTRCWCSRSGPSSRGARRRSASAPRSSAPAHGHRPFCGWEPDFAVITPSADRRLIAPLRAVPFAPRPVRSVRTTIALITSFATATAGIASTPRRLPPLPQGLRCRHACVGQVRSFDRDAAARRRGDAARIRRLTLR